MPLYNKFTHLEFYTKHPQLENFAKTARYTLPSIVVIFLSHTKAENAFSGNLNNVPKATEILPQETLKAYVYASPFNILALSSVIRQPIFSVYPDKPSALSMKLATHGFYYPRTAVLAGLRTNLLPINPWCPNHFVLLKNKNQFTPVKSYAAAAATYKKWACSNSPLPKTIYSPLLKSKWKRKKVVDDNKEQSCTCSTAPASTKSSSPSIRLAVPRAHRPEGRQTKATQRLHPQAPQILAIP